METNVDELNDCIERCNTDYTCLNDCFFQLGEKNKLCPCGEKCPRKFDLKLFKKKTKSRIKNLGN